MSDESKRTNASVTLDDLASMVKAGFDDITQRMATKEDLSREISKLRAEMATKEDLGKMRSEMIDYMAKQNMELKGDLIVLMRGGDRKLFALIELMVEKSLLSRGEANRVTKLEPFPQAM